ncbi:MAG: hypothetical protein C0442_07275, partial [Chlorobiaceae bacterium]|nr:hypothetical protein [Chlorobiaceae bacterium]
MHIAQVQSIEQTISNTPENERIYLLYNLANENLGKNIKNTFIYAHEALRLANKLDDKLGSLLANYVLAEAHLLQGNYQESMRLFLASQNIANELQNDSLIVSIQKRIGIVYYEKGDINKAIVLLHGVEKKLRVIDDKRRLERTLNYLGRAYLRLKMYNYSFHYFNEARKIAIEMNDSALLGRALNNIGVIHEVKGDYDSALKYFLESLEIKRTAGSKQEIAITLGNLGSVYLAKNDFIKSEKFLNEGLELADSIHNLRLVRNFLNFLGTLKVKTGNYQEAYNYNLLADSVDNRRHTEYVEQHYEELKILFELDQIKEDREALLKKSKTMTYIFIAFASIVLIFLIIVSSLYLKKKKATLELEKSKVLLNDRYEFIEFISRTSTDFINLPFNEIDETILRTLEFAVKLTKVERGFIFLISSDGKKLILSHEWCSPELTSINKIKPEIDIEQSGIDLNKFKKSHVSTFQISNAYKSIHFEFLSNELSNLQIKSLTNIALAIGDNVIGIIGFGSSSKEIFWTEEDTHLYKLIGQIIANAINRKEMNEELISNEYQFRSVWENSFDAMRLTDETGKLIEVNKAFCKLVNMEKENLLGQSFGVIYEDYKQNNSLIQYINFFDSRATKDNYETLLSLWDGRKLWVEVSTTFTEGKDGKIFLLSIFKDINSKKLAEASLIESEKKHRTLIESMQDCVFVIQDTQVVFVNKAVQVQLGYSNEDVLGKSFFQFVSPKDLEVVTNNHFKRLGGDEISSQYEFRMISKPDRRDIYVSMSASVIEYNGRSAIFGTLKNISARKKSELFDNAIQK